MRFQNLEAEMRRRGLRQEDVARVLKVHRSRVSRIVCGHIRARARERRMIAELLRVSEKALFPPRVLQHGVRRR